MPRVFQLLPRLFTRVLGDAVPYTVVGTPVTIYAIFETTPSIDSGFEAPASVSKKIASVRTVDVPDVAEGAMLADPAGVTWRVVEPIEDDGEGMTALTLERNF